MPAYPTPSQSDAPSLHDAVLHMRAQGHTVAAIATTLGITESRVRSSLSKANLVNVGKAGRHAKLYEYQGKQRTIRELAQLAGVSIPTMYRRLNLSRGDAKKAVEGDLDTCAPGCEAPGRPIE